MVSIGFPSIRRCFKGSEKAFQDDTSNLGPQTDTDIEVRSTPKVIPPRTWQETRNEIESKLEVYKRGDKPTLSTLVHDRYVPAFKACRYNLSMAVNRLEEGFTNDNIAGQMTLTMNAYPDARSDLDHVFDRIGSRLTNGSNVKHESGTKATGESPSTTSMLTAPNYPGMGSEKVDNNSMGYFTELHADIRDKLAATERQLAQDVLTRYASIQNTHLTPNAITIESDVTNWDAIVPLLAAAAGVYS
jgi:hypothetical protein